MKQSTKNKIGAGIAGIGMFLGTVLPLAAQDNQPARAPYNPRVGDSATATIINVFKPIPTGKEGDYEAALADVDGNPATIDDQRIIANPSRALRQQPKYQLQTGDTIAYIENEKSIIGKVIYSFTRTNR
jgi:hypothetical protein